MCVVRKKRELSELTYKDVPDAQQYCSYATNVGAGSGIDLDPISYVDKEGHLNGGPSLQRGGLGAPCSVD